MATRIPATAAKARFSEILERIRKGESFCITLHGEEAAKLVPARGRNREAIWDAIGRMKATRGVLNPSGKPKLQLRNLINEGRP